MNTQDIENIFDILGKEANDWTEEDKKNILDIIVGNPRLLRGCKTAL